MSATEDVQVIVSNRRARHEYFVLESLEVGIVLVGTEVKSVRAAKVNLQDAYASVDEGQLTLYNMHISPFEKGSVFNHDPLRPRRLLATKKQIRKLGQKVNEKGLTLVPLQLYFSRRYLKIELGVCKGKKTYDKRESLKRKESGRDIARHST
jgi:SsrA-binding protein